MRFTGNAIGRQRAGKRLARFRIVHAQVRPPAGRHDTGRSGDRSHMRRPPSARLPDSERDQKNSPRSDGREPQNVQEEIGYTLRRHPRSVSARLPLTAIQPAPRSSSVREKNPRSPRGGARVVAGPTGAGYGDINIVQHRIRSHFSRQFFCQRKMITQRADH